MQAAVAGEWLAGAGAGGGGRSRSGVMAQHVFKWQGCFQCSPLSLHGLIVTNSNIPMKHNTLMIEDVKHVYFLFLETASIVNQYDYSKYKGMINIVVVEHWMFVDMTRLGKPS